jgi:hypothetical protein
VIPVETPAQRAQADERRYDRGRDAVRDQLTDAREARAIAAAERQAEAQRIANEKLTEDQGKAGGYAIQGRAGAFARALSGSYSGVVGLPLFETAGLLESFGLRVRSAP